MSDDFKVRFRDTYNVHASTAKRDHVTDNAVDNTPSRDDGQRHRRDSAEFSMTPDGDREDDEAGARDEPEGAHAAPATEQTTATPADPPTDPKPGDDDDREPGAMLDLTG